jgi:hypothetical protein
MEKFNQESVSFKYETRSYSGVDFGIQYSKLLDSTLVSEKRQELKESESKAWEETNRCLWIHLGRSTFLCICTFFILYYWYYTRCRSRNTSLRITSLL